MTGVLLLQMTVTALVTSMNPSITARQNTGEDSEQVSTLCNVLLICRGSLHVHAATTIGCLHKDPKLVTDRNVPC